MIKAHSFRRLLYRILFLLLIVVLVAYGSLCAYLYSAQRDLLYVTNKSTYHAPDRTILPHIQEVTLYTPDGFELMAWYQPPKDGYKTILYLHGNATSISQLQSFFAHIVGGEYGLLAFSYRGYGASNGKPSEAGLFLDAETAVEFLHQHGIEPANMIVMGRSLGSGVAVHLATLHPFHQTILLSPYTSITHVAQLRYPYIPISWLLKDHFDSLARAPHIISPVCIFHGKKDTIIPEEQSARLMDAIRTPKERIVYPDADHINLDTPSILLALRTQCPQL
ncbi:MAG: alpha/beta hydrolase [Alphaproteobacteria bacterium]|nr:MAG: alpha/beta hydrolase [Alphaproteobacteria bacterium]